MLTEINSPSQAYDLIRQRTKDKDQRRQELRNSFQRQAPTSSKVLCLA